MQVESNRYLTSLSVASLATSPNGQGPLVTASRTVCLKETVRSIPRLVKNCSASELIPILSQYSELDSSTIYSDCWKAYDGLVDYGAKAHYRVKHSKNEFANGKNHINGIENFFSKRVRAQELRLRLATAS